MKFKDILKNLKFNFRTHPVFSFAFIIATAFVVFSFALCFTRESFVKQCENGDIAACDRACAIKGRTACANLAFYYHQGIHVRKNEQKALYYYQKSCSQKLSYACRQAEQIEKQLNYKILNNQQKITKGRTRQKTFNLEKTMVKAVANSPPIYNRNVSYATNTAIVFSYESSYKHALSSS